MIIKVHHQIVILINLIKIKMNIKGISDKLCNNHITQTFARHI